MPTILVQNDRSLVAPRAWNARISKGEPSSDSVSSLAQIIRIIERARGTFNVAAIRSAIAFAGLKSVLKGAGIKKPRES